MLTQEELKQILHYDEQSGIFTWIKPSNKRIVKGSIAGCKVKSGHIKIRYNKQDYFAHKLAWLYKYGVIPGLLDHKDRNPTNNAITNLRVATKSNNQHNRGASKNNELGIKGICFCNYGHPYYMAQIRANGRNYSKKIYLSKVPNEETILIMLKDWLETKRMQLHGEFACNK